MRICLRVYQAELPAGCLCVCLFFLYFIFCVFVFVFVFVFYARQEKCASACYQAVLAAGWVELRRRLKTLRSTTRRLHRLMLLLL